MSTDICRWIFLLVFLAVWTKYSSCKEIRVVCYYTNWSVYRPGTAKFSPQNINPYLCTHLVYAFGGFTKENTLKPFDKYQDIEKGGYAKFTGLKTYNKNLKTLLAIGGWNEGSSRFSPMVANPERRKELIKNAIKFLRQNHFDGLDLDWEYPSFRDGGKSRDKDNYAQLVQEIRQEFERESEKTGRPRLLLTMAVPAGIEYINKGYDVPKLTKYLDWMNILSYDYHSAFEPAVNHHAPLYSLEEPSEYNYDTELNIDYTIQHYLKNGADPNKLILGIPTYGRSYTLFNPDANEIGAPADGPGDMGEATRENGYLAYYEICEYIKSQDWEVVQPNPDVMGPYAFKGNQWVGYDDEVIARKKAAYVAEKGLGGIMFWSIDNDDFRGNCHGKPYPIIEAAKEALISAYGLTDDNLVSPPAKKGKTRVRPQTSAKSSETAEKKRVSTSSRRRNRTKSKSDDATRSSSRAKIRRKQATTTEGTVYSSLELVTPSYTTPVPPSTPDAGGGGFKCEDEGFYPHPKDCKKYYWCLSGPGELGIIAHQFTCPAGLYFNKAADSCDYTRNVLCNKKLSKGTSTTESSTSATSSTIRIPPKITAATSRTTVFRTSTTTEAYEDEYEYEDDEEDVESSKNPEEDPKVIKELLDLIRKAGGIEQLEKQLNIQEDGTASVSHSDVTTPSSISKSLVERVLGKAAAKSKNSYTSPNRNSRGPQNEGLKASEEKQIKERGRPQYTTITRQRSRTTEINEEVDAPETEDESMKDGTRKQPEYVNIRRNRVSTTTVDPEENSKVQINRNKILGEDDEDEEQTTRKQYVNIRRQRPSTTEETSTSKYTIIRRGSTTEADASTERANVVESSSTEKTDTKLKYKIIRRGSSTEPSTDNKETTSTTSRRGSPTTQTVSERERTRGTTVSPPTTEYKILKRGSTTTETPSETAMSLLDSNLKSSSTTTSSTTEEREEDNPDSDNSVTTAEHLLITSPESISVTTTNLSTAISGSNLSNSTGDGVYETQAPQLLEPRPFSLGTSGPTSSLKPVTESSTRITKVSESNKYKPRLRQKSPKTDAISTTVLTTEKSAPFRTRAPSRFKHTSPSQLEHETTRASVRSRKRFSTTTEPYSENFDEYDLGRTYRPSEIADLSSLTAVDFEALNKVNNRFRHRRIRPSPTAATTTTTAGVEESLKTSSRTSPLARKQPSGSAFSNSRRIIRNRKEPPLDDQINSSSDTTHRIRQYTRTPSSIPSITSTTEESTRRNRKIIRRLRPIVSRTSTSPTESENIVENASVDSRYSRPSTTLAVEVNKLSTTIDSLEKKVATDDDDTSEDVSSEEDENIKLSESNIRENSNVNNDNVLNSDDGKKVRKRILKRIRSKVDEFEKTTQEPNVIIRTRKIIRKLRPTESTVLTSTTEAIDVSTKGRKRKIIRRLKPTTATTEESIVSTTQRNLYIRGRPFTSYLLNQKTTEEEKPTTSTLFEDEPTKYKPTYKSKYKTITRTTTEGGSEEKTKEPIVYAIDRSKYNTINRGTTSTTTEYKDDVLINQDEEEEADISTQPRYRIYRPTTFHDDDDEPADEDDESIDEKNSTKPHISTILNPVLLVNNDTENEENEKLLTTISTEESTTLSGNNKEQNDNENDTNEEGKEGDEDVVTTTTTVRNYVNPILSRQKNRPTYKRPKLTTHNPIKATSDSKFQPRIFAKSTTSSPKRIAVKTEQTENNQETERKFVPKSTNRYRYVPHKENKTEASPSSTTTATTISSATTDISAVPTMTTELNNERDNLTTTEVAINTTEDVEVTTTYEDSTQLENGNVTEAQATTEVVRDTTVENIVTTALAELENTYEITSEVTTMVDNEVATDRNETTTSYTDTSVTDSTTETTTPYYIKSTFRSLQDRPTYKLTPVESTTTSTKPRHRFNQRNRIQSSTTRLLTPGLRSTTPVTPLKNIHKYGSIERTKEEEKDEDKNFQDDEEESSFVPRTKPRVTTRPERPSFRKDTKPSEGNDPRSSYTSKPRISNSFRFRKTTEAPKVVQDLSDIDTEAVRNRNKNLFSKKRKMNTPFAGLAEDAQNQTISEEKTTTLTTTPSILESVTKPTTKTLDTTEYLTTLHHVFAETETLKENVTTSTTSPLNATNSKLEKLIEVNRIVEIHETNRSDEEKDNKVIDKVGVVNRVTVVKVVDGGPNNEENEITQTTESATPKSEAGAAEIATVEEISNPERQDRKFELHGQSRIVDYSGKDSKTPEVFDGGSSVNIITPRPYYSTDASTISLEGLFQTDSPRKLNNVNVNLLQPSYDEELLETGNSRYVNVRILGERDDYITMRAHVVEVTPKSAKDTIKIVPIQVEMSRRLISPNDFRTKVENGVSKVNLQIFKSENS